MKINRVYIEVHTEKNEFRFDQTFSKGLNVITSYENTVGKSTIGEAILFCLGMEEILGNKNEKAVKPVLRSNICIKKGGESYPVIQSDIYIEIEHNEDIISIRRSPKHNSRMTNLISVYKTNLVNVLKGNIKFTDYYVHDPGSATKLRGFHTMLASFLGLELPLVSSYDGGETILYIQLLTSCFYIEQKQGWRGILATLPTYYKIKDLRRRVIEYVLGLSVFETEKEYYTQRTIINNLNNEWNQVVSHIKFLANKINGLAIDNIEDKPFIMNDELPKLSINIENDIIELSIYKSRLIDQLNSLKNCREPVIENQGKALNREMEELNRLESKFQRQLEDALFDLSLEEDQFDAISERLSSINQELSSYKELYKLQNLGSLERLSITHSSCPTCGQAIDGAVFDQDKELNIMSITDSITHLENERNMLLFSIDNQSEIVDNLRNQTSQLNQRMDDIRSRIRTVKSDLISNNQAISESHIEKIITTQLEYEKIENTVKEITIYFNELRTISKKWAHAQSELKKLPKDFINMKDRIILGELNKEFTKLLELFGFESTETEYITINQQSYSPNVSGFDLYADSSASDTIRIIWAYIVALQKISIAHGHNLGFLFLDEPAQQNTDLSSSRQLLNQLCELAKAQQVFMFYKLESKDSDLELFKDIDKSGYFRLHSDIPFISVVDKTTNESQNT